MELKLKNIKVLLSASDETYCYEAVVYKDSKKIGLVTNQGSGGCDNQHIDSETLNEINEWCKKNLPSWTSYDGEQVPTDFEMFCANELKLHLDKKELKKILKKVAIYDQAKNSIYTYPSYKPSSLWGDKEWGRFKKNKDQIIMNKISESEALEYLNKAN